MERKRRWFWFRPWWNFPGSLGDKHSHTKPRDGRSEEEARVKLYNKGSKYTAPETHSVTSAQQYGTSAPLLLGFRDLEKNVLS